MKKTTLLFVTAFLLLFSLNTTSAQSRNIHFFGSYDRSLGNIIASVSPSLGSIEHDEISKLRNGSVNQFEVGAFINSFGLGIIHNFYSTDATTTYQNYDMNRDGLLDNGMLGDKLSLKFTGLEILYRKAILSSRFDVLWRIALGIQSYSLDKTTVISDNNPADSYQTLTGSVFTGLIGAGFDYHINKRLSVGIETSLLPGKYKKLKDKDSDYYTYEDNVSRLSTGLKLTLTL
jgi:hypothetical protein